jgi:hypothetical protein
MLLLLIVINVGGFYIRIIIITYGYNIYHIHSARYK